MNREIRKFAALFMTALVGIILIVGLWKYEKRNASPNANVKSVSNKFFAKKTGTVVSNSDDAKRKGSDSVDGAVENVPDDKFDPLVDDNTPDDNPDPIIEDPEMEQQQ